MPAKSKLELAESVDQLLAIEDLNKDGVEVELLTWGLKVKIRGLTRSEVQHIGRDDVDEAEAEAYIVSTAVVHPPITLEQAKQLMEEKSVKGTEELLDAILKESGLDETFRQRAAG
jgi:hypothetical protein